MDPSLKTKLLKQKYRLVGEHGAVKVCHWMRQKLFYNKACYKENFYGISCHRCLQLTPALNSCTQACQFCWRYQGFDSFDFSTGEVTRPVEFLDRAIEQHRKLINGFKGDPRCSQERFREALNPNQVAISLSGEPLLYPYINELIAECRRRGMSTFVVSNGTTPDVLENMTIFPTQLYITIAAPNKDVYNMLCRPVREDNWELLLRTLKMLPHLKKKTRTAIRHTLVDGLNIGGESGGDTVTDMNFLKQYAELDKMAEPDFIEPKGYVFVGYSRKRLSISNMPSHKKISDFAQKLASLTGYQWAGEQEGSRVVVLKHPLSELRIRPEQV
ncbi:MAG: 4-demethylwyosine synthase TYW1 [Thermoplasmata archaeon]